MLFLATAVTLFAMCGVALGGPVRKRGSLQGEAVNMFEYCTEPDLNGGCSTDRDSNVDVCELVHRASSGASTLIYRHFECAFYLGADCKGERLVRPSGQHNLPDKFRNSFRSYKCYRF